MPVNDIDTVNALFDINTKLFNQNERMINTLLETVKSLSNLVAVNKLTSSSPNNGGGIVFPNTFPGVGTGNQPTIWSNPFTVGTSSTGEPKGFFSAAFDGMSKEEKDILMNMFKSAPDMMKQRDKMLKEKEEADKEWKEKINKK